MPSVTPYVLQSPRARRNPDLGALTTLVPGSVVDAALAEHNVVTQRLRRLPMRLLVYFLLVMALFPSLSYRELQARMEGGWELLNPGPWQWLTSSAISHARARLPWQVMATLFESLTAPGLKTDDGYWRNYRLVALDGSSMEMATSVGNEATFGGPTGKEGCRVGDPQVRILALVDCWTRAVVGSVVAEFGRGEARLAVEVMSKILPGMLILADRGFVGIELLHLICQARGHVLWRVKTGVARRTSTSKALPDASYLTKMRTRHHHGRGWITGKRPQPITVRVIEFWLNGQLHRLMTTLLDPVEAPARDLILLYTQRWEIETFYRECKGDERGRRRALRSRTPEGVLQEIWAIFIVHLLTRTLVCWVVDHSHHVHDPKAISFAQATAFLQDHLGARLKLTRRRLLGWAAAALTDPGALLRPRPTPRSCPRQVKSASIRYRCRTSSMVATVAFDPSSIEVCPSNMAA